MRPRWQRASRLYAPRHCGRESARCVQHPAIRCVSSFLLLPALASMRFRKILAAAAPGIFSLMHIVGKAATARFDAISQLMLDENAFAWATCPGSFLEAGEDQ